jgi:hypothetical protein
MPIGLRVKLDETLGLRVELCVPLGLKIKIHLPLCLRVKIFLRGRRGTDIRPGYLCNYFKGSLHKFIFDKTGGRDVPPNQTEGVSHES